MTKLNGHRNKINKIDKKILDFLSKRFSVVEKIGVYKKINGIAVYDKKREEDIVNVLSEEGKKKGISRKCIQSIWRAIFEEAYSKEKI